MSHRFVQVHNFADVVDAIVGGEMVVEREAFATWPLEVTVHLAKTRDLSTWRGNAQIRCKVTEVEIDDGPPMNIRLTAVADQTIGARIEP